MEFIPTEEALQFIHQKDKKNKAFFEELEGSYYTEKEEELGHILFAVVGFQQFFLFPCPAFFHINKLHQFIM